MHPDLSNVKKLPKWKNVGHDLALYIPTGVYYVRKSFRRYKIPNLFKTTGETKLMKAKAKALEMIQEHMDQYLKHGGVAAKRFGRGKSVAEVIDEFLKYETPTNRRDGTQENHRTYFNELKFEWGRELIDRVDENEWKDWLAKFKSRKNRTTYNDYSVYMNMLIRYAHRKKYVSHLVKLPFTDKRKETGRVYTQDELDRLFDAMSEECKDQFVLSYECAMRLREVLYLDWDRVNLKTGEITLTPENVKTGSRTGRGRGFICTEQALERLKKRYENRVKRSPYVFPSPFDSSKPVEDNKTAWIAAKRRAGIKGKARWHDLRHTAISEMLMVHKLSITDVSKFAGVSSRTLERVYLHSTAEQTRNVSRALRVGKKKS